MSLNKSNKKTMNLDIDSEVELLESYMSKAFAPVRPRDEFIQGLRDRIARTENQKSVEANQTQFLPLILIGFLGGLLIIVTAIRAISSIIEAFQLLRKRSNYSNDLIEIEQ